MKKRKLRGGMVGGGIGAFIGAVHRMAATMDGQADFVAGALSSDPARSRQSGAQLYLEPERTYGSYQEMARREAALPAGQRLDFVSIVTHNNSHLEIAEAFLKAGFNVVCEKPLTTSLAKARRLRQAVRKSGKIFALTHNYTGYPMVKQARHIARSGKLGKLIKVVIEYPQGWLAHLISDPSGIKDVWRVNPDRAGNSSCIGDIGTHAENLGRYITGLTIERICAQLTNFVKATPLDTDGNILIEYKGGACGILHASQVSSGEENGLSIRVYGTKAGLEWNQENPNYLTLKDPRNFTTTYSRGSDLLCASARQATRLPWAHPEGYIEAFANIYLEVFKDIRAAAKQPKGDYPTVEDGLAGVAFIESALKSSRSDKKWTKLLV